MENKQIEVDLNFVPTRDFSPQWAVKYQGKEIAVVTERYFAEPKFVVNIDGEETAFPNREDVVGHLISEVAFMNAGGG